MSEEMMKQGVLVRGFGGFYVAVDETGTEHILRCKKKFRRIHISPLVGDSVAFIPGTGEEHGWLEEILPQLQEQIPVISVTKGLMDTPEGNVSSSVLTAGAYHNSGGASTTRLGSKKYVMLPSSC